MTPQPAVRPLVLVMDDEENIRRLMCTYLDRHADTAIEAATLEAAVDVMRTRKRAHVVYKPEGFDTMVNFLDQPHGPRSRPLS